MKRAIAAACIALGLFSAAASADLTDSLKPGPVDIKSAGPLAFGPDGVLFIGDAQQGAVYAVATGDTAGDPSKVKIDIKGIDQQIAAMLGTAPADILINDVAVNPASGQVYLSVSRGKGATATPVIIKVDAAGKLSELKLAEAKSSKATLTNAPGERQRTQSITDIAFVDGRVVVAGLSNEQFASKLRALQFPFEKADDGTSVEIYHGAHGALETRSPVRTFTTIDVEGKPMIVAAYTCTPLVTFPISELKNGQKITGKTVAELGNWNTPLDMITYKKDGREFLLMANTARGVMKIPTDGLASAEHINTKVNGTAGVKFETIADLKDVKHLDKLNATSALILVAAGASTELRTIALP
jgi:hypothetical protein